MSDDEGGDAMDVQDPNQAGWLGSVRSWISSGAAGAQAGGANAASDPGHSLSDAPVAAMTPDEIRQRRLSRLLAQQQAAQEQAAADAAAAAQLPPPPQAAAAAAPPPAPAAAATAAPTPAFQVPQKRPSDTPPPAPQQRSSSGSAGPAAAATPAATGAAGLSGSGSGRVVTMEARVNAVLRKVFRVTATAGESEGLFTDMSAVLGEAREGTEGPFLSSDNLPEVIAARLGMGSAPEGGGLAYLWRCYGRCQEELGTVQRRVAKGAAELAPLVHVVNEALTLIINYSASCLMEPGMFGESDEGPQVLINALTTEDAAAGIGGGLGRSGGGSSGMPSGYLSAVLKALEEQGAVEEVAQELFQKLSQGLQNVRGQQNMAIPGIAPQPEVPLMTAVSAVRAIAQLCMLSKAAAAALPQTPNFKVPAEGSPEAAPRPVYANLALPPMMQRPIMWSMRSGHGVEVGTVLGNVTRLGPDINNREVLESFRGAGQRSRQDIESTVEGNRATLLAAQGAAFDFISGLVRGGAGPRGEAVRWAGLTLLLNVGAEASRVDHMKVAGDAFMLNMGALWVKLAMPIVTDPAKFDKVVDASALLCSNAARSGIFPKDTTPLVAPPEGAPARPEVGADAGAAALADLKSFSTQCFFLAWRALHLGLIQVGLRHNRLHTNIGWYQREMDGPPGEATERARAGFDQCLAIKFATEVPLLRPDALSDALTFLLAGARWLTRELSAGSGAPLDSDEHDCPLDLSAVPADALVFTLPEHFVEDVLDFVLLVTRYAPRVLGAAGAAPLEPLMTFVVYLLAHPSLVRSPHLRAKLGDVLYHAFLPDSERPGAEDRRGRGNAYDEPHTALLYSNVLAQKHLAPSLLLLYGDVEHTGYYDKLEHRFHIAALLKYLWRSPDHRSTFQRISQDTQQFVRFANGLMNETNSLVAMVMEKLPEIRSIQQQQKDGPTWAALPDERRNEILERLNEAERAVTSNLQLCNETLHMVSYLTSDPQIRQPFLLPELLPRLASMLLSVVGQLVGSRGLEIKVDNPESYNFRPREMLASVMGVVAHFVGAGPDFDRAVATSGFYQPQLLPKAAATVRKLGLLEPQALLEVDSLCESVALAAAAASAMDEELGDVPDEFQCPLMCTIMDDPVLLPTSGMVVERSTIMQHLLNDLTDPFNRKPLTVEMVQPAVELKARIDAYRAQVAKRQGT